MDSSIDLSCLFLYSSCVCDCFYSVLYILHVTSPSCLSIFTLMALVLDAWSCTAVRNPPVFFFWLLDVNHAQLFVSATFRVCLRNCPWNCFVTHLFIYVFIYLLFYLFTYLFIIIITTIVMLQFIRCRKAVRVTTRTIISRLLLRLINARPDGRSMKIILWSHQLYTLLLWFIDGVWLSRITELIYLRT